MDATTSALAAAIGGRIRQERQGRHWTLDRLADSAGVSRRMLVNVEQGTVNPSVGTLLRISDALGVGLPALVEAPKQKPVTVTRDGDAPVLWTSAAGGRATLVAGTSAPDVVELWDWSLAAGDRHASEAHSVGTQELVHVQHGALSIEVAGESIELRVGDAMAFPGDVPHAYANPGTAAARFTLTVFEPGVRPARRTEVGDA